jgi:prephenate dehydratase
VVGRRLDLRTTTPAGAPSSTRSGRAGKGRGDVAFQGETGAFSELAARQVFGGDSRRRPCGTFRDVVEAVATGRCRWGILPVENTLAGSVHNSFDLLLDHDVRIVGEIRLRIVHHLIAPRGVDRAAIRKVYAHPQAAAQCDRFLARNPGWRVYQVYDTAGSLKMILEEGCKDTAAIAGAEAAARFGMAILEEGIESDPRNYTRFVILGPPGRAPRGADKATLVYGARNEPGSLLKTLEVFRDFGLNLTRIESRPIPGRPWEYLFHVDVAGRPAAGLIARLRPHTTRLKVLGVYRSA